MPATRSAWKFVIAACLAGIILLPAVAAGGISLVVSAPSHAPPPDRVEARGLAPFKDAVWIDGRWDWRDGRYVWSGGHWEHPKKGFNRWQRGDWAHQGASWIWIPGKWL
jgi:hypothetical protein